MFFLLSIFGRVARCNDVRGVSCQFSNEALRKELVLCARALLHTRISMYIYRQVLDIIYNTSAPVMSFVPRANVFLFFGQNGYRYVNLHEQSLASAVARLERGETCAASYISLWAKGESGRGVGGATEPPGGERSHSASHERGII